MADELKRSQLARIVVPAITDAEYSTGLADAFDKINDNFKKIASLPFLQGVQGDSYQLEEYPIWEKDTTENWILTEDGKILLDSIFGIDTTRDGNSFSDIRECIGQLMPEENNLPATTKDDPNQHGFGIKSIKYITELYGGKFSVRVEDNMFFLRILFPLSPEK